MLLLQATVTEEMKTLVPALILTLTFVCQGWGRHFLVHTKDSNLTNDFQYDEDYLVRCNARCGGDHDCPSSCPECRKGDWEKFQKDWHTRPVKRKKRTVNGQTAFNRCYVKAKKSGGTCFGPTNTVETKEGIKTIPELRIGDLIRTSSGNHHSDFTEVTETRMKKLIFY